MGSNLSVPRQNPPITPTQNYQIPQGSHGAAASGSVPFGSEPMSGTQQRMSSVLQDPMMMNLLASSPGIMASMGVNPGGAMGQLAAGGFNGGNPLSTAAANQIAQQLDTASTQRQWADFLTIMDKMKTEASQNKGNAAKDVAGGFRP